MTTTGSPTTWQPPPPPPEPPGPPEPPERKRSWPSRHKVWTGLIVVLLLVVGAIASANNNPGKGTGTSAQNPANPPVASEPANPPASQPPAPAPVPSPDGTYTGSGDYVLSPTLYGDNYLVGEVDVHNTGNVGIVARVRFTWPQEGMPPIVAHKTVRVPYGHTKTVRFHVSAGNVSNSNVIDLLQSWQEGHNFKDGYTWKATIIDTFGAAH